MNEAKLKLIKKAMQEHNEIYPCKNTKQLNDCFTLKDNKLFFWFNTKDKSTHILVEEV